MIFKSKEQNRHTPTKAFLNRWSSRSPLPQSLTDILKAKKEKKKKRKRSRERPA
ncbi:hypothetical protein QJS10_CPB14g00890 [Acorus calamus]|uniref:Uncharacterized protein n=1 Tax=Acorus calamus TaxID=4465 RepID=A0AAV9DC14_ACOCL|nr:hypothetical protein QJS10_CPB14g00890 [Acorus calamus]